MCVLYASFEKVVGRIWGGQNQVLTKEGVKLRIVNKNIIDQLNFTRGEGPE